MDEPGRRESAGAEGRIARGGMVAKASRLTSRTETHSCGWPQHFLYFLPLPHGQGSLRPNFSQLAFWTMGTDVRSDFEEAGAMLALNGAKDPFQSPQCEMLLAVSLIGRNALACLWREISRSRLASRSNSSRFVIHGSTIRCRKSGRISSINSPGWSSNAASTSCVQVIGSVIGNGFRRKNQANRVMTSLRGTFPQKTRAAIALNAAPRDQPLISCSVGSR
jgi:hypothetical protein